MSRPPPGEIVAARRRLEARFGARRVASHGWVLRALFQMGLWRAAGACAPHVLIDRALRVFLHNTALRPPAPPPLPERTGAALALYRDANDAWFCLHDHCLINMDAYSSELELAWHTRAVHDDPAPLPVPAAVLAAHMLPCLPTIAQLTMLAAVDRASRRLVQDHWGDLEATWDDLEWLRRQLSAANYSDDWYAGALFGRSCQVFYLLPGFRLAIVLIQERMLLWDGRRSLVELPRPDSLGDDRAVLCQQIKDRLGPISRTIPTAVARRRLYLAR